jgi:sn-glycerol 3-phosphate transport system ATP-binding protein
MVFQSYALFPHLSVAENVVFGLRVRRVPKAARRRKLVQVLELVGLAGLERRKPAQLSGGQRQRVALARAIVADHPLCLMDEPLSNLDAKLRGEMRHEIRALQRRLGMTVIYVTHDQVEAMSMADRILLLRAGRVEQMGRPAELYERPASAFAAGFVGSPPMSLLPLEALRAAGAGGLPDGLPQGALLGLRPEAVRVVQSGAGRLRGSVRTLDYLGADTVLGVEVAGHRLILRVPGYSPVSLGDEVDLDWAAEAVHVFHGTTGERLAARPHPPPAAHPRRDGPPAEDTPSRRHLGPGRLASEAVQAKRITKGA